ncbi:MAG: UDP-glucose--hexose-1-phosphate uridylyltransferase [Gammaproteobacteria bacterium]|nr:UDP-glucose--hexose-1-phosphate uridylyltransferase [Gammaproteobacteria bacterium]
MTHASSDNVHRRRNPLNGRWVLVSPHRNARPWRGEVSASTARSTVAHDPGCYLCPGNPRISGILNPRYETTYVFDNDFPALFSSRVTEHETPSSGDPLFLSQGIEGHCRVVCYSPDHHRSMARLSTVEIRRVVDCWATESADLGARYEWVQIFENKGEMMGCSNPHPHGQIWASNHLPDEPQLEETHQKHYWDTHRQILLSEIARYELNSERKVSANDHWLVIVPWWATWPFETLLLPRFDVKRIEDLGDDARQSLALMLGDLTRRYDALFGCEFPYSMGWHGAPHRQSSVEHWLLHAHFYPPLLRSATVRKFMVGYEMLAEAQRDLTPEQAAEQLRALEPS